MIEIAKHRAALETLGLDTLDGVRRYEGALVKDHHGRRDILRIQLPDNTLYLKRNWRPYKKDGLRSLLCHGEVWSVAKQEWENSLKLQRAGLHTAELVAYGQDCGPLWERFSFIITEAAPGQPLSETFDRFEALAAEIRKMHDAGIFTPDLFTRHIFVDGDRFSFIDMARLDRGPASRDLAALNVTAPLRHVSAKQRLRFLKAYGGRHLWPQIEKRVRYLLKKRRKFADFSQAPR